MHLFFGNISKVCVNPADSWMETACVSKQAPLLLDTDDEQSFPEFLLERGNMMKQRLFCFRTLVLQN